MRNFIWPDRRRAARRCAGIAVLAVLVSPCFAAAAPSCRGYPQEIRASIKKHVEALRAVEHEAADRLKGLDTRPFEYLADRARVASDVIADKNALAVEERLGQCPNPIAPVRRLCAAAAQALVELLEQQGAGPGVKASKQVYAEAMPQCERWMKLAPLNTVFRSTD